MTKPNPRKEHNAKLWAIDQANRCDHCKQPFQGVVIEDFVFAGRFCSDGCLESAKAVAELEGKAGVADE